MAVKYVAEIFGSRYPLKSEDRDLNYLKQLAAIVDNKMKAVSAAGISVDIKNICILASLQIAEDYMEIRNAASEEIKRLTSELSRQSAKNVNDNNSEINRIKKEAENQLNQTKSEAEEYISGLKQSYHNEIEKLKKAHATEMDELMSEYKEAYFNAQSNAEKELSRIMAESEQKIAQANSEADAQIQELKKYIAIMEAKLAEADEHLSNAEMQKQAYQEEQDAYIQQLKNEFQAEISNAEMQKQAYQEKQDAYIQQLKNEFQAEIDNLNADKAYLESQINKLKQDYDELYELADLQTTPTDK